MIFTVIPNFGEGVVKQSNKAKKAIWKKGGFHGNTSYSRPLRPTTVGHELRTKASYYRWSAKKGFRRGLNDIITGRPHRVTNIQKHDVDASRAADIASAKSYMKTLKDRRKKYPRAKKLP